MPNLLSVVSSKVTQYILYYHTLLYISPKKYCFYTQKLQYILCNLNFLCIFRHFHSEQFQLLYRLQNVCFTATIKNLHIAKLLIRNPNNTNLSFWG